MCPPFRRRPASGSPIASAMGACRHDRIARLQEAQSRERWGHAGSVASLGTVHARRRTLAAGSGPPLAARRPRFAILASLAAEPGSRARAAPRCRPQEAQSRKRWGHAGTTAPLGLRKPNRVSDGGMLAPLHRSELPMPVAGRVLRPSWAPLAARRLRFAILASLAAEPGSRARAAPRSIRLQEAQSRKRWGLCVSSRFAFRGARGIGDHSAPALARSIRKSTSSWHRKKPSHIECPWPLATTSVTRSPRPAAS